MPVRRRLARIALPYLRTARYVADLLVWSRVFVVRRTSASLEIDATLREKKGVVYAQPTLQMQGREDAESFAHGFNIVYDVLFANLQKPSHRVGFRHALPGPAFAGVYLWDSAFISLVWKDWDRDVAFDVLESVIALRSGRKLQHVVADFVRGAFTQPPLIAWAAMRVADDSAASRARLERFFQPLAEYHAWLDEHRRLPNGLYFWAHPYESGVENAPRFSSTDESRLADTTVLAAPDFSSYVVLQAEALAQMAELLGLGADAKRFAAKASQLRERIEALLWDETDGLYYDRNIHRGEFVRSRTIASLLPLTAGVPGPDRAARLLTQIRDPAAFGTLLPLPSVAANDPDFEKDMWRGPVWINTAFLVLDGLRRYGFDRDHAALTWRLCDGVFRVLAVEHQVYEFYDPLHFHTRELNRKKGNWWKAFTLGSGPQKDFVGWSGLVNTLVVEGLVGLRRDVQGASISPHFPDAARGLRLRLRLPQDDGEVELTVGDDGRSRGRLALGEVERSFDLAPGETLRLTPLAKRSRAAHT